MRRARLGRPVVAVLVLALVALGPALPAGADPAGPSDYRTEVLGLEPATDVVEIRFIGGDAFLELAVEPGHEVEVTGYQGEPFIRVEADGTVLEDRSTPTWAASQDRYGQVEIPDLDAPSEWEVVADGGRYAWHDHRTHWMGRSAPPGSARGDQILEAVVPLTVDGRPVDVTVASFRTTGPGAASWVVVVLAGVVAGALSVLALRAGRLLLVTGVAASMAVVVGVVALRSVPAVTGPSPSLWVPAVLALASVLLAALVGRGGSPGRRLAALALTGLAGVELALWAWLRREAVVRSIIPTSLPFVVDRAVVAVALVVGLVAAVSSLIRLVSAVATPHDAIGQTEPVATRSV